MENNLLCQAYLHDQQPVLSFCLNPICDISYLCCSICLKERHLKHQQDIKDKNFVTELIQSFIHEQSFIEQQLEKIQIDCDKEIAVQIKDFISAMRIRFSSTFQLIKDQQIKETHEGIIEIKQWYYCIFNLLNPFQSHNTNFFHVNHDYCLKEQIAFLKRFKSIIKGFKRQNECTPRIIFLLLRNTIIAIGFLQGSSRMFSRGSFNK